jgi:hypothetical protein
MCVCISSDTTARSAGFKSRPDGPPMDVVLYSCCVARKEIGEETVGVGGRGKYPGAPPHHKEKERKKQAGRKGT